MSLHYYIQDIYLTGPSQPRYVLKGFMGTIIGTLPYVSEEEIKRRNNALKLFDQRIAIYENINLPNDILKIILTYL